MPDWSIRIIPNPSQIAGRPVLLVPDLVDALPGDPLQVQEDDLVSWNNETGQPYQPWPTDALGKLRPVGGKTPPPAPQPFPQPFPTLFLTNMVRPKRSSSPAYDVVMPQTGNVIFYCLIDANGNPTQVRGQIIVSAIPAALNVPSIGS
jgi:hypothetical protein